MHELTSDHCSNRIKHRAELCAEPCSHGGSLVCPTPHEGTKVLDPGDAGFREPLLEWEGMQFSQNDDTLLAAD